MRLYFSVYLYTLGNHPLSKDDRSVVPSPAKSFVLAAGGGPI
jgi:hypothetical protein